jgi:hypothetical protein
VDLLEAGTHAVANQTVFVYNLQNLHNANLNIRGILGEDFLKHFDLLIDNVHGLLCLDETAAMRRSMKGPHIPLVVLAELEQGSALPALPIISVRLSDATRSVRLMLDSGANGAVLFNSSEYLAPPRRGHLLGTGVDGRQMIFGALPPQDMKIGSVRLADVSFCCLDGNQMDARAKGFDGILTFGLFRRVFIAHSGHFAVLEPK